MPVDLEDLAAGYAHRPPSEPALARARRAAASVGLGPGDIAVDVGGGRGAHAAEWVKLGARAVVIDPAAGMAREAASRAGVSVIRATSQGIPLRDLIAKLMYFHLSIHYGDWRAAIDEVARVLRPGGECWIWTMGEEHHRASFLTRWFPSVGDIDAVRFPPPEMIADYSRAVGMRVESGREIEHREMPARVWQAATEARFVSTLQLISDEEFRSGLEEFERSYPDPNQVVDYVLTFDWIRAQTQ